jgi:hypothetical protein
VVEVVVTIAGAADVVGDDGGTSAEVVDVEVVSASIGRETGPPVQADITRPTMERVRAAFRTMHLLATP